MPSDTSMVNVALSMIGGSRITSLTDGTKNANVAADLYDDTLTELLRSHPWNFATKRVELARSGTTPASEFDYGYVLPADWVRTVSVHDNDNAAGRMVYKMGLLNNQRVLLASPEQLFLGYVALVDDPNIWTADFVTLFEYKMAQKLAVPVAKSNTLAEEHKKNAERQSRIARSSDAMGSTPELRPRGSWDNARSGWR